ncbi:Crp/Fnr family transcriptional regulator [Pseudanabaena sp. FACHB-2040]|uniref:Crp/Fnr family transcriptional regulator n=1 Tax=Pseudanabaena sp. FACHB-2040 TaxID=2692859 RepID=UPI00168399C3|nr:Crp/Fnr family transcriptional regulator [Pseudanabaena sp. FACHB-2040]MBD2257438.1 Crp/Fnr family transcriptional regulator [Pseudanabaena sp. FACHB-2040]
MSTLTQLQAKLQMSVPVAAPSRTFPSRTSLPTKKGLYWLLKSGVARTLCYLEDGSVITLGIWGAGDVVGEPLSKAQPFVIETLSKVDAEPILAANWQPPAEVLLSYWQQTEALLLTRANRRADAVLLGVLGWLARRFGQQIDRGCLIGLRLTHQDLAELSGLTRVTVTRLLGQLEDQGLIYRPSRQLILAQETEHWHYEI